LRALGLGWLLGRSTGRDRPAQSAASKTRQITATTATIRTAGY